MYISIPRKTVTGTAEERRKAMKKYFIGQMGGKYVKCHKKAVWESTYVRYKSGRGSHVQKCNLEAHHTIRPGQVEAKNRLANIYIASGAKTKEQKKHLRMFADNLETCILLCKQCHGTLHGKEKVSIKKFVVPEVICNLLYISEV